MRSFSSLRTIVLIVLLAAGVVFGITFSMSRFVTFEETLTLEVMSDISSPEFLLAKDKLKTTGIDLLIKNPSNNHETLPLFIAGQSDLALISMVDALHLASFDADIKIIAILDESQGADLFAASADYPTSQTGTIPGTTFVPRKNSTEHLLFEQIAIEGNLDTSNILISESNNADSVFFYAKSYELPKLKTNNATIVGNSSQVDLPPIHVLIAKNQSLSLKRTSILHLVENIFQAREEFLTQPLASWATVTNSLQLPVSWSEDLRSKSELFSLSDNHKYFIPTTTNSRSTLTIDLHNRQKELLLRGWISDAISVQEYIDDSLIRKIYDN